MCRVFISSEVASGKDVLAFVIDEGADWPEELKDAADLKRAMELDDDEASDKLYKLTRKKVKGLKVFKQWFENRGLRRTYRTRQELKLEVERALKMWRSKQRNVDIGTQIQDTGPSPADPGRRRRGPPHRRSC